MTVVNEADAYNEGKIITTGNRSIGMWASCLSKAHNTGVIVTEGTESTGMLVESASSAENFGDIQTLGESSFGMFAERHSSARNAGIICTNGTGSPGISVLDESEAVNSGTIMTEGTGSPGILAKEASTALNSGAIVTSGSDAPGMAAFAGSKITNTELVETSGANSYGLIAANASSLSNSGSITTYGEAANAIVLADGSTGNNAGVIKTQGKSACGMHILEGSEGENSGEIHVSGHLGDAVRVTAGRFVNTGTLSSLNGSALTAENGSSVELLDGTDLRNSTILKGDATSSLLVDMNTDITAELQNFGRFTKAGTGTMLLQGHSSCGDTLVKEGTLKLDQNGRFVTETYTQTPDATLFLYAGCGSGENISACIPLWVENTANLDGDVAIDVSQVSNPGFFECIRASDVKGRFDKISCTGASPYLDFYRPRWIEGGSLHFTGMAGYSFSEQALGIAAAIDGWSVFRHFAANRLHSAEEGSAMTHEDKTSIYCDFLVDESRRDSFYSRRAGFNSETKGLLFGTEKGSREATKWGLLAGYTEREIDFTGPCQVAADWEKQDTWHIGGYYSRRIGNWVLADALAFHSTAHESYRKQAGHDAKGKFSSRAVTNDIRAMYAPQSETTGRGWRIVPEVGLNTGYFIRDGYEEAKGFTYGDFETTIAESLLGVRLIKESVIDEGIRLNTQLRLAWIHNLSGSDIIIDRSWGGDTRWYTETLDEDRFSVEFLLSARCGSNLDISLSYEGLCSDRFESHGGRLTLQWFF
ncbi:MAG: autotransporter domain-containing protein [Thermovirgaceae bacterium]